MATRNLMFNRRGYLGIEWLYREFPADLVRPPNVVVSVSGGKDSTVILLRKPSKGKRANKLRHIQAYNVGTQG